VREGRRNSMRERTYTARLGVIAVALCFIVCQAALAAPSEVEPNDSSAAAMWLGTVTQTGSAIVVGGTTEYPGDSDWYRLAVEQPTSVVFMAESDDSTMQLVLFSEELNHIVSSAAFCRQELSAGTYLLRVDAASFSTGDYRLTLTAAVESEPNDLLPNELGALSSAGELRVYGSIDPVGDIDRFSFVIPDNLDGREVRITVDGPGDDDSQLTLLRVNPDRSWLETDRDSGGGNWSSVGLSLSAGQYMIILSEEKNAAAIGSYWLTVVVRIPDRCEPNNSLTSACDLGIIGASSSQFADASCPGGDVDFYAFQVEQDTLITAVVELNGEGDSLLTLYTPEGRELASSDDRWEGNRGSRLSAVLPSGSYFLSVTGFSFLSDEWQSFDYRLTGTAAPLPLRVSEQEPNESLTLATVLSSVPALVTGQVGGDDSGDILKLDVQKASTLYISLDVGSASEAILTLADKYGSTVSTTWDSLLEMPSESFLEEELDSGTYYIMVEAAGESQVTYELLVVTP
jgi:hypothetical protein